MLEHHFRMMLTPQRHANLAQTSTICADTYLHRVVYSQTSGTTSPNEYTITRAFRLPATKASQISIWKKVALSLCAAAVLDLSELLQQAKSWLRAAEFKNVHSPVCRPLLPYVKCSFMGLWITPLSLLYSKQKNMKRGCFPLCVLPLFLPPPLHLFPLLPLRYSASIVCPLPLSLNRPPFSSDKRGFGSKWAQPAQTDAQAHPSYRGKAARDR